jgi:hypothetical protein
MKDRSMKPTNTRTKPVQMCCMQTARSIQHIAIGDLGAAIERALDEAPVSDVLSILTSAFVGLTVELVRRHGHDVSHPINVDGGPNRDITIHAPKHPSMVEES